MARRHKGVQAFYWIIGLLLIAGLAGFGVTNFGGSVGDLGRVGETKITAAEYSRALEQQIRSIESETGQAMPFAEVQRLGIDRLVLQRLLAQAALDDEAQRIGLSVGDAQVRNAILEMAAFRGPDGSFSRDAYDFALDRVGMTAGEFEQQIRRDTARGLLQAAVTGGVALPPAFVDTLYAYAREARDVSWARLTEADLTEPLPEPGEEDLRAYYEAHPDAFTTPETRKITYAWLTPDMLASTIEVDENALRALYDERHDEYVQPERRLVERLIFASPEEAEAARKQIDAGETTFDNLVAARNLTLDDVDLGEVARADLGSAAEAVFALEGPGIAGPVETSLGPALFRVNAVLAAQETPFEEVRDELAQEYLADRARRLVADRMGGIEDLLASGATLEELAEETGMELGEVDYRTGLSEGIAGFEAFRAAAEAVSADSYPEVEQLEDGSIFALRLDALVPPTLQPFETVEAEVREGWRQAETESRLVAAADAAKVRLEEGATADELGLAFTKVAGLLRDGFVEALPPEAVTQAFAMDTGEFAVVEAPEGPLIVRVDRVIPADGTTDEARALKAAFAQQAAEGVATDVLTSFMRAVEADIGIELNQAAINAVHTRFP